MTNQSTPYIRVSVFFISYNPATVMPKDSRPFWNSSLARFSLCAAMICPSSDDPFFPHFVASIRGLRGIDEEQLRSSGAGYR
jgi:hypothetical protein